MALKLKFVNGRGHETYNTKKVQKEHKKSQSKWGNDGGRKEQQAADPLINQVKNSILSNVEV